jgi:uncharacterized protein YbjT (DUF2867 family)
VTKVFVGGATGATGRAFVRAAQGAGLDLVVHVRPQSAAKYAALFPTGPAPRAFDLQDAAALGDALAGCDAVVSTIGTMRDRFARGDTYASSDVATTQLLVDGARKAGARRFVLLSAWGADRVPGAYYAAKRAAERIVVDSGLEWTLVRPSMLVGEGRGVRLPDVVGALGRVPGLRGVADDARPIPVEVVAAGLVAAARGGMAGRVLTGRHLWTL